jgi:hypothetical protein
MQQNRRRLYVLPVLGAVAIGGVIFLMLLDIPAPSAPVEQAIPTDRFLKP